MDRARPRPLDVLLAEDIESEVQLFKLALERCEFPVSLHVVENGYQCLHYLQGNPASGRDGHRSPDVLLLDLKMPHMDGFQVLEWLQNHPECRVIPTVIFSNSNLSEDVERAYRLGANAYFCKPSHYDELKQIVSLICQFWTQAMRPAIKGSMPNQPPSLRSPASR